MDAGTIYLFEIEFSKTKKEKNRNRVWCVSSDIVTTTVFRGKINNFACRLITFSNFITARYNRHSALFSRF